MSEQTGSQTSSQTGGAVPPHRSGPRVTGEQMRDMDRLRRSSSERYIAGVAGGLGRHFDIDPTLVRVVLVVLTLFGGAGVLLYAAVWLFVPDDAHQQAPIEVSREVRRVLLVVAVVVAVSIVFGTPFWGSSWGSLPVPLIIIGLIALALFATRDQRRQVRERNQPPPPWGGPSVPPSATTQEDYAMTTTQTPLDAGPPPPWLPPPPPAYVPPLRPRRTGAVLFWPTLAVIAIALGSLGIYDISHVVVVSAYAALALTLVAVMLLVGAFRGRPGGLIALGIAGTLALVITSIVASSTGGSASQDTVRIAPSSSAALRSDYSLGTGSLELDLTKLASSQSLAGRVITVDVNAGEIKVLVPSSVDLHVDAEVRFVGEIDIDGRQYGGIGQSVSTTLSGSTAATGSQELNLILRARVGQITVEQR